MEVVWTVFYMPELVGLLLLSFHSPNSMLTSILLDVFPRAIISDTNLTFMSWKSNIILPIQSTRSWLTRESYKPIDMVLHLFKHSQTTSKVHYRVEGDNVNDLFQLIYIPINIRRHDTNERGLHFKKPVTTFTKKDLRWQLFRFVKIWKNKIHLLANFE